MVPLRWSQVDLERRTAWIAADEAKGGEDIHVSLCGLAVEALEGQRGKHLKRLIQNGTPLYDLQEMGGWKSAAIVRQYAHLAPAHMARHAAVVDGLLRVTSTAQ